MPAAAHDQPPEPQPGTPFASTGPQGHRQRMRERVISRGAAVLADYEILEMLLFYGTPRGDTKPQAKALINGFGALPTVLSAPADDLGGAGVNAACLSTFRLVRQAAHCLARAEAHERPQLSNWEALLHYFDTALSGAVPGQLRALFLDNRNRLLADEAVLSAEISAGARDRQQEARSILRRALEVHATALILIRPFRDAPDLRELIRQDEPLAKELGRAGEMLAITLHDAIALQGGEWASLKQLGRL